MRITARGSAVGAVAFATVLLAALTGCSSGSDDGDNRSKLLGGLGTLVDDNGVKQVTFLDAARVRKLSSGDSERFSSVAHPSSVLLNQYGPGPLGQTLKVTQIDTAVDTDRTGHLEGSFDATAITKRLKSDGYTQSEKDGEKVWTRPGNTGISIQVSRDEISYSSRDSERVPTVTPKKGSSLADNKEYRRAAECLGDVYRADFAPSRSSDPVSLAAVGQQATSAAKNAEVLCLVVDDYATAQRLEAKLRLVVSAEAPKFDGTKVTLEKGDQPLVKAVVPDTATQRPGRLAISDTELWRSTF
ncbi:hypothetical protein [Streptomyces sp. NPDC056061]|uniref:hypothetical protein n=1 Tax=Streptomyces sp. NPDC056061 TaxID=3345700 RepID=UPI0035D548BA